MKQRMNLYRVAADFSELERDALDALCTYDYRPPAEQLRWLVMQEAQRRGLVVAPPTVDAEVQKHNHAVPNLTGGDGVIVATHPS